MSLDSPVLVVFSIATNLAWYSLGVVNWHGNLKQVLVGAQHKLVIYGDSSLVFVFFVCLFLFFVFLFVCLFALVLVGFGFWFFKTRFLCIALDVLELTL